MAKKPIAFFGPHPTGHYDMDRRSGDMIQDSHIAAAVIRDYGESAVLWKPNTPFRARMEFDAVYCRAGWVQFRDARGALHYMHVANLCGAIRFMMEGVLEGWFAYTNSGGKYGISYLENGI